MNKIQRVSLYSIAGMLVFCLVLFLALQPVLAQNLKVYEGKHDFAWSHATVDQEKKTIFILADNDGTEMFDLLAPFYLFNATEKANVYIVSEKKAPVLLVNSLFILPHFTFSEIDSLGLRPDVIIIPNLTVHLKTPPKEAIVNWIKKLYTGENIILAICDGAATTAATGIYDGKLITTHSSDWKKLKKQFPNGGWVQGATYTKNENLYSTAGVSNATEGSLAVIQELFGNEVLEKVKADVRYPHRAIKTEHQNRVVNSAAVMTIVKKILFKHDRNVGVLLQDSVNEFVLATVLDTYSRTFPASLNTFGGSASSIKSKFGLTLLPTAHQLPEKPMDELHIIRPDTISKTAEIFMPHKELVTYDKESLQYPFVVCLDRIQLLYGMKFTNTVKLMLDYN